MVKEIERSGIPVVHLCTVVPISLTVGANRIVPAIAIPHPFGDPAKKLHYFFDGQLKLLNKQYLTLNN